MIVDIDIAHGQRGSMCFPDDSIYGQLACHECLGTGWWDFAPYAVPGSPCVVCKGTGREWVSLI